MAIATRAALAGQVGHSIFDHGRRWLACLLLIICAIPGCATFKDRYQQVDLKVPARESAIRPTKAGSSSGSSRQAQVGTARLSNEPATGSGSRLTANKPLVPLAAVAAAKKPDIALAAFEDPFASTDSAQEKTEPPAEQSAEIMQDAAKETSETLAVADQPVENAAQKPDKSDGKTPETTPDSTEANKSDAEAAPGKAGVSEPPATEPLPDVPGTTATDVGIDIESFQASSGINLDQAINLCLIADPIILAGLETINQANADALTASLKPNPQLFTDIQLLPLTRPFTPTKQGGPPQLDAIVSYPIDWFLFGKRAAAMRTADLGVRATQSEYEDLIRVRVLDAATAFYGVLEAKALLKVAQQDALNFRKIEELTSQAVDIGGRSRVELNRIQLDRLRSEQSLRDAEKSLVTAMARLRVLLGQDNDDPAFDIVGTLETSNLIEPLPVEEAVATAEQNRPDLEAARWRIAQADAGIDLERRRAYPTVLPSLGYTKQYQTKAIGFPDADSYLANLTISVPIFDRNQGNRAKADSLAAQAELHLQARRVALRGEVVQATKELNTSAANAKAVAQGQLRIAQQVRDSINSAFQAGGSPLIDVLDAQRNYRETYKQFITSRANYARAAIQYSATLGRQMVP